MRFAVTLIPVLLSGCAQLSVEKRRAPPHVERLPSPEPGRVASTERLAGLSIRSGRNHALHTHGGAPAVVGGAELEIEQVGDTVELELVSVDWLQAHCRSKRWDQVTAIEPTRLYVDERPYLPGPSSVSIAPGKHRLRVTWSGFPAYQSCDRFGIRFHFRVHCEELIFEVPYDVIREEPFPQ